jgi:hypothetical protein
MDAEERGGEPGPRGHGALGVDGRGATRWGAHARRDEQLGGWGGETPLGVKHAFTSQIMIIHIVCMFIITCNIS